MHNWKLLLFLPALLPAAASAELREAAVDGCGALAAAVYGQVTRHLLYGHEGQRRLARSPSSTPLVCNRTAETASAAFVSALQTAGIYPRWDLPHPGDFCLSGKRSECYPDRSGLDRPSPLAGTGLVSDTWRSVQLAMGVVQPNGAWTDTAVFDPDGLEALLERSLRRHTLGSWQAYQLAERDPLHR